ncbi:Predicted protein [Streptococcus thermophilus LMD-9]|nr:Predicted protein [Streptococcus thermophilus LMD-9]
MEALKTLGQAAHKGNTVSYQKL